MHDPDKDIIITPEQIEGNREEIMHLEIPGASNKVIPLSALLPDPNLAEDLESVFGNQAKFLKGGINPETNEVTSGTTLILYAGLPSSQLYTGHIVHSLKVYESVATALKSMGIEVILVQHQRGRIEMEGEEIDKGMEVAKLFKATLMCFDASIIGVLASSLERSHEANIYPFSENTEVPQILANILEKEL
jgi:hypothetical protein